MYYNRFSSMFKYFIVFIILLFCIINAYSNDLQLPKWFIKPPKEKNVIYATGYAGKKNMQLALVSAANAARSEISRVLNVEVNTMTKSFLEEINYNDGARLNEYAESISKSIASNILIFTKIVKQETQIVNDKNIAYVLVKLDLNEMKNAIEGGLVEFKDDLGDTNMDKLTDEINNKINKKFNKKTLTEDKNTVIDKLTDKEDQVIEGGARPDWVTRFPSSGEYFVGIGNGSTLQQAKDAAISTIASQIEVSVKSEIRDYIRETNNQLDEDISQNIKLSVKQDFEDLELAGLWHSEKEDYWAYYRLNIDEYKRKQQEKMDNAKINGLDFLKKCDEESDPALKFKYAFLGYYLVGKYVTRAIKVEYNGKQVILVNELITRMQQILSNLSIKTELDNIEIDKIYPEAIEVVYNVSYSGRPVKNFPVKFIMNKGELDISKSSQTDSAGKVSCLVNKAISSDKLQSFFAILDIEKFIEESTEGEEEIVLFYKRISKLGIPEKETVVNVNPPVFNFSLVILDDLGVDSIYQKHVKSMISNFKYAFTKKTKAAFTDSGAKLTLEVIVSGTVSDEPSKRTGAYYTRLDVTMNILDTVKDKDIFTKSTKGMGIKGGSKTREKSVRAACDEFMDNYSSEFIEAFEKLFSGE